MTTDGIGLYIHIPFCVSKCNYCDFASFAGVDGDKRKRYISRLCDEITGYKSAPKIKVNTVFFGGGTPSLLTPAELEKITSAVRDCFELTADAEITCEINPKTITLEGARALAACGVNRASIGLQSMHENELKKLGRIHDFSGFQKTLELVRKVGIDNVSADVMFGIPYQTQESLAETLRAVADLGIPHISCYGLILEEGTPFWKMRDTLPLPDEDAEADMYAQICRTLAESGYAHYEISNFAKAGFECRHNLKYWRDEEYIGVGLAAHSYYGGKRFSNPARLDEYLFSDCKEYERAASLTREDEEYEYAMMRLRLSEGISLADYSARFAKAFSEGKEDKIARYADLGLLAVSGDRLALTEHGFYISNTILSDIL